MIYRDVDNVSANLPSICDWLRSEEDAAVGVIVQQEEQSRIAGVLISWDHYEALLAAERERLTP